CVLAIVNGACLALFGLSQFFTSPHNVIYWHYQSPGQVFGPFISRTHFAFYLNICIGLGVGFLLWANHSFATGQDQSLRSILQKPLALWTIVALGLMLGSVIFCLSRGGFLALGGAGLLFVFFWLYQSRQITQLGSLVLILAIGGALIVWFG